VHRHQQPRLPGRSPPAVDESLDSDADPAVGAYTFTL
jgi:hypothetical protein